MFKNQMKLLEDHRARLMSKKDVAHDRSHVYRVLNQAMDLGQSYEVDLDVLGAACLLHDIARDKEDQGLCLDHAYEGGQMAYDLLMGLDWPEDKAEKVKACIDHHRKKRDPKELSLEGQLLFDADKLDQIGGLGLIRQISHCQVLGQTLDQGLIEAIQVDMSFLDKFYTDQAKDLARRKIDFHMAFVDELRREVRENDLSGT